MSQWPLSEEEKTRRFEEIMGVMLPAFEKAGERWRERAYKALADQTEQEEIKPNSVNEAATKITGNLTGTEPFLLALRKSRERITRELLWRDEFLMWYQKRVPAIFRWFPPLKQILLRCWLDSADKVCQLEPQKVDLSEVNERMLNL